MPGRTVMFDSGRLDLDLAVQGGLILDLRSRSVRPRSIESKYRSAPGSFAKDPPAFLDSTRGPLQFKIIAVRSFFIVLVPELFPNRTRGPAPGLL